ncbi:MAG: hypothetical protein AAF141_12525 [Pseudomonadota bacterium]
MTVRIVKPDDLDGPAPATLITLNKGDRLDPYTQWHSQYGADFDILQRLGDAYGPFEETVAIDADTLDPMVTLSRDIKAGGVKHKAAAEDKETLRARLPLSPRSLPQADDRNLTPEAEFANTIEAIKDPALSSDDQAFDPNSLVITGVMDSRINIANAQFRLCEGLSNKPGPSRVDFAWIQDGTFQKDGSVRAGREWTNSQINNVLAKHDDEASAVRELEIMHPNKGPMSAVAPRVSHGTHVLDLAAGHDFRASKTSTIPAHHRIIAVQLPDVVTADTSGTHLFPMTAWGLKYILDRATAMSVKHKVAIPLVINFSYGTGAGPHNAEHAIERMMRKLIVRYRTNLLALLNADRSKDAKLSQEDVRVEIVLPAGNRRLAQAYAQQMVANEPSSKAPSLTLPLRLQPDDHTSNFLEVWIPIGADFTTIEITPPGATEPLQLTDLHQGPQLLVRSNAATAAASAVIGRISLEPPSHKEATKRQLFIALAPTIFLATAAAPHRATCPSGLWKIKIVATGLKKGERLESWVQRDDVALAQHTGARPAYFDDDAYEATRLQPNGEPRLDDPALNSSVVQRQGSINGMATRPEAANQTAAIEDAIEVVGGLVGNPFGVADGPAFYSGIGFTGGKPKITHPDSHRPSDRSRVLRGVMASGFLSGSHVALSGTSVAAPQRAREIATRFHQEAG